MIKNQYITVDTGYAKIALPLEHPKAGVFLSMMKEVVITETWGGNHEVTNEWMYGQLLKGKPKLQIEELTLMTEEEKEQALTEVASDGKADHENEIF